MSQVYRGVGGGWFCYCGVEDIDRCQAEQACQAVKIPPAIQPNNHSPALVCPKCKQGFLGQAGARQAQLDYDQHWVERHLESGQ